LTRGFLVTFSGLDGSGKSSQVDALRESLRTNGVTTVRAWTGINPIFTPPFNALVRFLGLTHRKTIHGVVFFWRDLQRNSAIARLWPIAQALDFVPRALLSVKLPLLRGRVVISDRYVYDLIAELSDAELLGRRTRRLLLTMLPRPGVAFLMDVSEDIAWKRAAVPGRAREQPLYDLSRRRQVYKRLAKDFNIHVINGEDQPDENRAVILHTTIDSLKRAHEWDRG
jgi:thymidylate kinase